MGKPVIFVEDTYYLGSVEKDFGSNKKAMIIALNAEVMWELEKRRMRFRIPYDYYDIAELRALNENLYVQSMVICKHLNDVFGDIKQFKRWNINVGDCLLHPIKTPTS